MCTRETRGNNLGRSLRLFVLAILCLLIVKPAKADQPLRLPPGSHLLAQSEADDAYDPFSDYSEFEESSEEEEDINFFRNGRLFTMGFLIGYRGFTGNLGTIYSGDPNFGLYLSYFFDLRFALQVGFTTGSHSISYRTVGNNTVVGNASLTDLSVNLKYYLNTQNVTRGLADLNPYLLAGFSQYLRSTSYDYAPDEVLKDAAFSFNLGGGIELPMMRNKMYFGVEGAYHLVNFANENQYLQDGSGNNSLMKPAGDSWTALGIIGVNF
jgi:hypothetical protein